jgi:hypothetical protein
VSRGLRVGARDWDSTYFFFFFLSFFLSFFFAMTRPSLRER